MKNQEIRDIKHARPDYFTNCSAFIFSDRINELIYTGVVKYYETMQDFKYRKLAK